MDKLTTAKIFGTGQVALPNQSYFYEIDDENFGVNFLLGVKASKLVEDLKKANEGLS